MMSHTHHTHAELSIFPTNLLLLLSPFSAYGNAILPLGQNLEVSLDSSSHSLHSARQPKPSAPLSKAILNVPTSHAAIGTCWVQPSIISDLASCRLFSYKWPREGACEHHSQVPPLGPQPSRAPTSLLIKSQILPRVHRVLQDLTPSLHYPRANTLLQSQGPPFCSS